MFEELMANYKLLSTSDKRNELIKELKLMVAVFENMCEEKHLEYRQIKSQEILDINDEDATEDDYYEAMFVYVQYLKEVLGTLFMN